MSGRPLPDLRRRKYAREPKRRFLIYCEGANTEIRYFEALNRVVAHALISVEAIGPAGVPYTLAQTAVERASDLGLTKRARRRLDSFEERDEVWAVFDRDEHPNYREAIQLCEQKGVGVACSNPCFEVWLILHFADHDRPDSRREVQRRLRALCPEYDPDKGKCPDCSVLAGVVADAERRAEAQLARRTAEAGAALGPPHTMVWRLTRSIRQAAGAIR